MGTYAEFLARKAQLDGMAGFEPLWLPDSLFGFQAMLAGWAVRQGRGALFADCGAGKTPMALVWAQNVYKHTGRPVLLLTRLGVAAQIRDEGAKFGVDTEISRDGTIPAPVTVTNYERLERFDRDRFGGVICDESSALKSYDGVRRALVGEFMRTVPYRLLATATAAPNDYTELGTSSETLGYLGHMDMLSRFFTNKDKTSKAMGGRWRSSAGEQWRFKGHAEDPFWRWVASWARSMRKPSDLGFEDGAFILPPLETRTHVVEARTVKEGTLFDVPAVGLQEEREESRRTIAERCEKAAELLADAQPGIAWCHLNDEGDLLAKLIPGAVQVAGSDPVEVKEERLAAFGRGEIRVLVTKPRIASWGLNYQNCHRMTYFVDHSFEAYYQAVRRCWRFGQEHPVIVDVVTTTGGKRVLANLERKAVQADRMFASLTAHMRDALAVQRTETYDKEAGVPSWVMS
jgi:hypothetical protein